MSLCALPGFAYKKRDYVHFIRAHPANPALSPEEEEARCSSRAWWDWSPAYSWMNLGVVQPSWSCPFLVCEMSTILASYYEMK